MVRGEIRILVRRLARSRATLVVVTIGGEVYGVADDVPLLALQLAAQRACDDLARRGVSVDPSALVDRGREALKTGWSAHDAAETSCREGPLQGSPRQSLVSSGGSLGAGHSVKGDP